MSDQKHTPGPWGWQDMGGLRLVGQHGMRPIILDAGRDKLRGRDQEHDLMVPLDPESPDARLISKAPEMLEELKDAQVTIECEFGLDYSQSVRLKKLIKSIESAD